MLGGSGTSFPLTFYWPEMGAQHNSTQGSNSHPPNVSPDTGEPDLLGESIGAYVNIAGYTESERLKHTTLWLKASGVVMRS